MIILGTPGVSLGLTDMQWLIVLGLLVGIYVIFLIVRSRKRKSETPEVGDENEVEESPDQTKGGIEPEDSDEFN
jgi:hypothetical protein